MVLPVPQTPQRNPALLNLVPQSLTCHGASPSTTRPHRWPGRAGPQHRRCMLHSGRRGVWRAPGPPPALGSPSSHAGPGTQPGSSSTARPPGGAGKTQNRSLLLQAGPLGRLLGQLQVLSLSIPTTTCQVGETLTASHCSLECSIQT